MNKPLSVQGGIPGSTLKILAMVSMVIDHVAASVIGRGLFGVVEAQGAILALYWFMRGVGRIAFPIYCFLLVEGMVHTRDRKKYILRLFLFALISEIPFDLCFYGQVFSWGHQNVFWTLGLGAIAVWMMELVGQKRQFRFYYFLAFCVILAWLMQTDYGAFGVLYICLLNFFHSRKRWKRNLWGSVAIAWEISAPLAFLPIQLYNGNRGLGLKYVFYIFYPAHLFLLGFITYGLFGV